RSRRTRHLVKCGRTDRDAGAELGALRAQLRDAPFDHGLLELELGHAVAHEAAEFLGALENDDAVAGSRQLLRRGEPGRPGAGGGEATAGASPRAAARSAISYSTCLMRTGSSLMPSTQLPSHGAGQSLPVNSGKLLVAWRRSSASTGRPLQTRSFHSGMRFPS